MSQNLIEKIAQKYAVGLEAGERLVSRKGAKALRKARAVFSLRHPAFA